MVKIVKLWKKNFYKNDDSNGGAMNKTIEECPDDCIVIHSQTRKEGRIWTYIKPNDFLKFIDTNKGLYEVITKYPHKVFFDIDKITTEPNDNYLNTIKNIILQHFPNAIMAISGSIHNNKTSFHIVLNNYIIHNDDERIQIKTIVKYLHSSFDDGFDWKVYTKNRNMKCINQSKDDGRIQEIIENNDYKAHIITAFIPDYSLPFFELLPEPVKEQVLIHKSKKPYDLSTLPKLNLTTPDDFDITSATPIQILEILPLDNSGSYDHSYTHLVARFCFYNDLPFETFLSWLKKKHIGLPVEIVNKWKIHYNTIFNFPPVKIEKIIGILKHFYPHISKDIHFRNFQNSFSLPENLTKKIETLNQDCFYNNKKYIILNTGMGSGKTAQTISFLNNVKKFLWIAPNKALATNTIKRFQDENIEVFNYENMKSNDKKKGGLLTKNKLIICLNSIHYILNANHFDVLIIDEMETLLDRFIDDFLEQDDLQLKKTCWTAFITLIKKAKKVLLLDAFTTQKTLKFIEALEGNTDNITIYERIIETCNRQINIIPKPDAMIQDIVDKLKNGNKLFIFYPYKNTTNSFYSMEALKNTLENATEKKGIFYNADVDDKIKNGLKDINTTWKEYNFIITNNIITCGVNYENLDFDYKYIFIASHNTPRDIIQVSYRARYLKSGIIKLCYMGKMNQANTWLNDCNKMDCPIYNVLYNSILIEKKAPIKRAIQLFCKKAHYKNITDKVELNSSLYKEIEELLIKNDTTINYENIEDIDYSQAEVLEKLCFEMDASLLQKFILNKYYFKKIFNEPTKDLHDYDTKIKIHNKCLSIIWNEKYTNFVLQLKAILLNENHLFNKIKKFNKLTDLIPYNITKLKINDEIKDEIFKLFSFKYVNKASATTKIYKEVYNTYFKTSVIKTTYEKDEDEDEEGDEDENKKVNEDENKKDDEKKKSKKHIIYETDEYVNSIVNFCKSTMIIDKDSNLTWRNLLDFSNNVIEI